MTLEFFALTHVIWHHQCINWILCHFDHSLLNYNRNFITPQPSWFLNHALPTYFLPYPLVFLFSFLYFFCYHHQDHLFVSPLSSLWNFNFEEELHWNLGRRRGETCLVAPIDWGWSIFFPLFPSSSSILFFPISLFFLPFFTHILLLLMALMTFFLQYLGQSCNTCIHFHFFI